VLARSCRAWVTQHRRHSAVATQFSALSALNDGGGDDDHAAAAVAVKVALTREEGKNEKLLQALKRRRNRSIEPIELPCIAHADGPDYGSLPAALAENRWDYVTVTSPEAARVLASAWKPDEMTSHPVPSVAAVGKATEAVLVENGIPVDFCPSKATAKVLLKELPLKGSNGTKVLYPASKRAQLTLEEGLRERGFDVTRLNTYDTVTATWDDAAKEAASQCRIACFASPSAIQGWLQNTNDNNRDVLAACIGETSAEACRKHGWSSDRIFYPDKPGIEGWVQAIEEAVESISTSSVVRS